MIPQPTAVQVDYFRSFGFLPMPGALPAATQAELFAEAESELSRCYGSTEQPPPPDEDGREGYFLPAMTGRTPTSLALVDALEPVASALLGTPETAPVYADLTVFHGTTTWHTDIGMPIPFVKFGTYQTPLDGSTGALRFLPGSHLQPFRERCQGLTDALRAQDLPAAIVPMAPGDLIAIHGHVWHAAIAAESYRRLQWSLPYISVEDEEYARRFYRSFIISPEVRGHDGAEFPFYGPEWLGTGGPLAERLLRLGAVESATA
jgi:phytanoyl-CoA dioxygenase PhyH